MSLEGDLPPFAVSFTRLAPGIAKQARVASLSWAPK